MTARKSHRLELPRTCLPPGGRTTFVVRREDVAAASSVPFPLRVSLRMGSVEPSVMVEKVCIGGEEQLRDPMSGYFWSEGSEPFARRWLDHEHLLLRFVNVGFDAETFAACLEVYE